MSLQIEARGLTEDEVREAIESALSLKNTSREDRLKRLGELLARLIQHDKDFATILFRYITEMHPDIPKQA
jgi:hypothetical protein